LNHFSPSESGSRLSMAVMIDNTSSIDDTGAGRRMSVSTTLGYRDRPQFLTYLYTDFACTAAR
jgi:hypothetical protein